MDLVAQAEAREEEARACFLEHDADNSGTIDLAELVSVFRALGLHEVDHQDDEASFEARVERCLQAHDANEDGVLSFDEFARLYNAVKGADTSRAPYRAVSLSWLIQFRKKEAGTNHAFDAVDFIAERHGGGSKRTVSVDGLAEHLDRRLEAERRRDGVRTEVRFEGIPFEKLSTANVVDAYVRPSCEARDESYAVTHVPDSCLSRPTHFVSHAWGNSFVDLVDTLENYFLGAAADDVYVWLDIFAVNQKAGRAMREMEDGAALAEAIDASVACLVVLDRGLLPLTRLWCLFEVGSCPADKLQLLTLPGMGDGEVVDAARRVDVDKALCFSPEDRQMIYAGIEEKFGSNEELTEQLQLRLMLRPMGYAADTAALLRRAKGETFRLDIMRDFARGGGGRAAVVEGVAGDGKSTISAKIVGEGNIVDAFHMCKRSDVRRQDPLLVAHSLAYQLALRRPKDVRRAILGLDADRLKRARSDADVAAAALLHEPLRAIPEGEHVVLLMDAMDEGTVGGAGRNPPGEVLQKVMKATSGTEKVSVVMTTRPDANAVRAVRVAMGVPRGEGEHRCWSSFAPASLRGAGEESGGEEDGGEEDGGGRLLRLLTEELRRRNLRAPADLDDAYRAFFEATPLGEMERRLLVTVVAAREPLTEAHLETLGLLAAVERLPGGGLLFERREHRLQALHGSVLEWLMDPGRARDFYAVPTSGHVALSRRSLEVLKRGGGGPVAEYALKHGHVHLAAALEAEATRAGALGDESLDVLSAWSNAFLDNSTPAIMAPLTRTACSMSATTACGAWLRRQLDAGRAKVLVPELIRLETALRRGVDSGGTEEDGRAFYSLVRDARWSWGRNVASRADAGALGRFLNDAPCDSPLRSAEMRRSIVTSSGSVMSTASVPLPLRFAVDAALFTVEGHTDVVFSVVLSPDGTRIASGSRDKTVLVWDASTGECTATLEGHTDWVMSVAFSPDGTRIVSGSDDKSLRVWDFTTGECSVMLEGHSAGVKSVVFFPDSTRIASGSEDKSLRIWDLTTGECTAMLKGHTGPVWSVTFSQDGTRIVSASGDGTLRIWDSTTGECTATLNGHSGPVWSVAFSQDGARIASASGEAARVWDSATGECTATLEGHTDWVNSVAFTPDGKRIASGSRDKNVRVWDSATGECTATLEGHTGALNSVAFTPDGARIVSGSEDKTLRVWDLSTAECTAKREGHANYLFSVAFSRNGTRLASGSRDETLRIWDSATGECTATLKGHTGRVRSVAFSPDGTRVVSGSDDKSLRVWDLASAECLAMLEGHTEEVRSVAFAPDGTRIVSGSDDKSLRLWDAGTGECTATLEGHDGYLNSVAFSPDGTRLVSGSRDKTLRIWDSTTGECTATLEGHTDWVMSVAFAPDGTRIASGSGDKSLRLWDAGTGECTATLEGHTDMVNSVVFSPDGKCIASGSDDTILRVWDSATGACTAALEGHFAGVWSVAFSPDGSCIASGSEDKTLRTWDTAIV